MKYKELIKKFRLKLIIESIIKSSILGLITGFSVSILIKIVSLIAIFDANVIAILVGLGVAFISTITFYFVLYQPNTKKVAGRIDGLGLDERVITMLDLESKGNNSFIAKKQHENTEEKLSTVNIKQLKFSIYTIPLVILLVLIPLTAGTMAIKPSSDIPISSEDGTEETEEDKQLSKMIEELRSIVRNADIIEPQRDELSAMIDALVERIKSYNTFDEKMNDALQTKEELLKKLEDFIIQNLLDLLHELIEDAEVRTTFKETLHQKVDDFKITLDTDLTLEAKIDKVKEFVDELQEAIIVEAVSELRDIVAKAEVSQEIKDICNGMIADLEDRIANVHDTYDEKMEDIKATKDEIIKLLIPPPAGGEQPKPGETTTEELEQLGSDMQEAIDNAADQLDELDDSESEEELEGELPIEEPTDEEEGNGESGEPNDKLPPPPPEEGEASRDVVIDGITPYLPILEEELPGITEKLAEGNLPDDLKSLIEAYLELITKNQSQGQ